MRAIWTGSISFGLVNIPVKLYSGTEANDGLDLNLLHKDDKARIRYARVCRRDGREVPWDEIVKGYEYQEGDYIVLTKDDFQKADAKETNSLAIQQFLDKEEIDIRYYEKPYYLEPDKKSSKAYSLLHQALQESGKLALVRFVIRQRERLGIIMPVGNALVLDQMRFPKEVRSGGELNLPTSKEASKAEVEMAKQLIKSQTKPFIPEDYHDTYTEKLEEIIEEKAKGHQPTTHGHQPQPTKTEDLMAALKASLGPEET